MYALVETGGKQYRLSPGDAVNVEKLEGEVGTTVVLGKVLMVVADDGATTIGNPVVQGVDVTAEIVAHGRGRKIVVFKYKPKVNYRRKQGHRQPYTRVCVTAIGAYVPAPDAAEPEPVLATEGATTTGGEA